MKYHVQIKHFVRFGEVKFGVRSADFVRFPEIRGFPVPRGYFTNFKLKKVRTVKFVRFREYSDLQRVRY